MKTTFSALPALCLLSTVAAAFLLLPALPAAGQPLNTILTNGLAAFFPLNGNANDATGNGNNGSIEGSNYAYAPGRFSEQASLFLNTNDPASGMVESYVAAPLSSALNFNSNFTLSVWVNIPNGLGGYHVHNFVSDGPDNTSANFRLISNVDTNSDIGGHDYLQFTGNPSGGGGDIYAFLPQIRNTWWQAVVVRSGNTLSLFQNGTLVTNGLWSASMTNNPMIWLGAMNFNSIDFEYPLDGGMADVRIYNRALSSNEVVELCAFEAQQFVFKPVTRTNQTVTLTWNTVAGLIYQPQYTTNLNLPAWSTLGYPLEATNGVITITDTTAIDQQRFYRVVLFP